MVTTGVIYSAHTYINATNARMNSIINIRYGFLGIYEHVAMSNAKNMTKNTVNGLSRNTIDAKPVA